MVLIDKQSRVPAYEQIRNQLLTLILIGSFAPHSQLPSIRSIAADAGVNINTVKRHSPTLNPTALSIPCPEREASSAKRLSRATRYTIRRFPKFDAISAARAKGLKKQEIIDILNEIYTQEEES